MKQIFYAFKWRNIVLSANSNFRTVNFWLIWNIFCHLMFGFYVQADVLPYTKPAVSAKLIVLDTAALESSTDYTVGNELSEIKLGTNEAAKIGSKLFPRCNLDVDLNSMVKIETQGEFQQRILKIRNAKTTNDSKLALVGFSRSSNAKTVAELLKNTSIIGISVGAAAPLGEINSNFYSVAYPLVAQWNRIFNLFTELKCNKVYSYFPLTNSYSSSLRELFRKSNSGIELKTEDLVNEKYTTKDCIFLGGNYSDVSKQINQLIQNSKINKIIGPGDWALSSGEIKSLLSFTKKSVTIYAPSGWPQNGFDLNVKSKKLKALAGSGKLFNPSPILAYSYDATLWAIFSMCGSEKPSSIFQNKLLKSHLIRSYQNISNSGNLVGEFFIHKFRSPVDSNKLGPL